MKIKTISRSEREYTRDRGDDMLKVQRNRDPKLHPFEKAREYTRALNAAKLEKVFAKPFVAALEGHSDGVFSMATSPRSLVAFVTGACDGEVRVWDISHRTLMWSAPAHAGFVRGLSVLHDGESFVSVGDDATMKLWSMAPAGDAAGLDDEVDEEELALGGSAGRGAVASGVTPTSTWVGRSPFRGVDCHWSDPKFATCGEVVEVWDQRRSEPVHSFEWGSDSVTCVRYNPAERALLASAGSDRSIALYDVRLATPVRKVVLAMRSNALAWNPMEPFNFSVANEDGRAYTFDMRKLERAMMVHKDHVSAVMDISYSPTGREFATGSYDRSVRIFSVRDGRSREVYHARRMQRVFCVRFSMDATFVLSGSDDTNIRIWKAQASRSLGKLSHREKQKQDYNEKLLRRYKHLKEVKRITRHRHVPKAILKARKKEKEINDSAKVREERARAHAGSKAQARVPERKKPIVKVIE